MHVLLVDSDQYFPASPLFADALGPDDTFFNEAPYLAHHHKLRRLLGKWRSARALNAALLRVALEHRPDILLVVKGIAIRPETLRTIKAETGATLVNFATDDPFNRRVSSRELVMSIREYDLYCCVRTAMIPDVLAAGCPRAEHVLCAYNPVTHFPPQSRITQGFDVTIIGGADADRIPFARALASLADTDEGVLALFGGYWERDPICRRFALGMLVGDQYRKALWLSKVAVCLVRRANRDDHAMKTFELPACGVCTLFEDTETHRRLFGALSQDIFFRTPEDLARLVRLWLGRCAWREKLAQAECTIVRTGKHSWQDRFQQIMGLAQEIRSERGKIRESAPMLGNRRPIDLIKDGKIDWVEKKLDDELSNWDGLA